MRAGAGIVLLTLAAVAQAQIVDTRVVAATVYGSGATVTREGRVELPAGSTRIELRGLPPGLSEGDVQIELGAEGLRIGQIKRRNVATERAQDSEVRAAEDALAEAQAMLQAIDDGNRGADLSLKFLESLATGYAKEAWTDSANASGDPESWRKAIAVLEQGTARALKTKRESVAAKRDAQRRVRQRQQALNVLRGGRSQSTLLEITISAPSAIRSTLRASYYVEDAYWSPQYEARLDSDSGALELAQRALVVQETDEPWNDVALSLSTGDPLGELEAPELPSEFLKLRQPVPASPPAVRGLLMNRKATAPADQVEEVIVTGTRREPTVGNFAVTYPIPGQVDLDNDSDEEQLFDLSRDRFDSTLITQVVPRESSQAFLAARFTYSQRLPLYENDMKVFVDGVFAGSTTMPTALPGAEVTLPMGQDRRITVTAKDQGGAGGTGGFIGKRRTERTDYLFEIESRRELPTLVEVRDRVPVARDKRIDVSVPRSATAPTERDYEDQPGVYLWRKELEAGGRWQIRHSYSVEYPAEETLVRE